MPSEEIYGNFAFAVSDPFVGNAPGAPQHVIETADSFQFPADDASNKEGQYLVRPSDGLSDDYTVGAVDASGYAPLTEDPETPYNFQLEINRAAQEWMTLPEVGDEVIV